MRGAYYQGRGGYAHSPPYPGHNQYSPPGQSPYPAGRGGWNGHQPYPNQGSPAHGYSPNQSPYPHNYSPGQQQSYYPNQQYQGTTQPGFQNSPQRGGFRGNHYSGPDRRPSAGSGFTPVAGRGRGAQTQFSNLSWTPASGTRGGRPATEAPRPGGSAAASTTSTTPATAEAAVDADDNPFRPSKDLRVEDEGAKEEKKMPPPTKAGATPTAPKSAFGFSLKTKNPVPPTAAKGKPGLDEIEPPKASEKDRESLLEPKTKEYGSRESSRYPSDSRNDRDYRPGDRDRERDHDRDRERRYEKYDEYYDRRPAYRDPRDRDPRDSRDPRDRDPRERDPRDIRDSRDS
ncbi:hypothetical protein P280DRAFT_365137, partial [Massarina eburnea CBS 473.64]